MLSVWNLLEQLNAKTQDFNSQGLLPVGTFKRLGTLSSFPTVFYQFMLLPCFFVPCAFHWLVKSKFLPPPSPVPHHHPSFLPWLLSCAINNSLFCALPCERRHTQSQGHGARGDCWVVANWVGHWLDSRLGAWVLPQQEGRGGFIYWGIVQLI